MIKLENISKAYGKDKIAVNNLNIELRPSEIVGFIGPNGAGKTTTINMLSGILQPTSGNILINGIDINKEPKKAKEQLCLVMDSPDLFLRLKGYEYLNFIADIYNIDEKTKLERIELYAKEFNIYDVLNEQVQTYSHGMRQKLIIVGVLVVSPYLWILDEPLTGLDPESAYLLKQYMKEHARKNNIVFFSTHVLEVAERLCDRIIIINKSNVIFDGTLEHLQSLYPEADNLESLFLQVIKDE